MKKQLRNDLQNLFNQLEKCNAERYEILEELKDMSQDLGLPRWCSAQECAKQLENRDEKYTKNYCNCTYGARARMLLEHYYMLQGKRDSLEELGQILANNGFWKNS